MKNDDEIVVGKVYGITEEGIKELKFANKIYMTNLPTDPSTKVKVIGRKQLCTCGTLSKKCSWFCLSKYREVQFEGGTKTPMSVDNLKELPEDSTKNTPS